MITVIHAVRRVLYGPIELLPHVWHRLPFGPLRDTAWLRLLVRWTYTVDAPLRRELQRRIDAKSP
jgi:hypothetical protein